jgi:NADH dehydrogenase [ubiquinone] 1 alpha subcomplex assembly factor 5
MIGGDALFELRTSLQLANLERRGGLAAHTSPLADVKDVGSVLQRAGFQLVTVDVDDIVVGYPSIVALMKDLRAMGESSALKGRVGAIGRDVMMAAEGIYRELHGEQIDGRTNLPATFRVIYFIAWKAGEGTPQPLERGSGMVSIKDVLEGNPGGERGGENDK